MTFQAYIFDLDGTIYLGDHLLPGARVTVLRLRESGKKVLFLSNKPIENRDAYAKKLTRLGIPTETEDVLNSSFVASLYFGKQEPKPRIYVIGEASLVDELNRAGLTLAEVPEETDVVLISLDRDLTYEKIHFAYRAAKMGARVWATNPDLVCPMPNDEIIDAGATIAALEAILRRPIDGLIGKPSELMIQTVLDHLQLSAEQCVIVGDRLETDILMGKAGGMATALVLTGISSVKDITTLKIQPDFVLKSIEEVLSI